MKYILALSIFAMTLIGCSGMQDDIAQYLDQGETIYVGKLDFIIVHPGKNRVMVEGMMPYGMTQTKCCFEWITPSGDTDSMEFDVERESINDIFSFSIENLEEGQHDFVITTRDAKGNSSIKVYVGGYSYGEVYQSMLEIRRIASIDTSGSFAWINWQPLNNEQFEGCEIQYEKSDGTTDIIRTEKDEFRTEIYQYKPQGTIKWRSVYLPDPLTIDEFYTEWEETTFP